MRGEIKITTHSEMETIELGCRFGLQLPPNSLVCFYGDLAAGKTTFVKGLAAEAGGVSPQIVNSPTYSYLNIYEGKRTVYHFDLYRLYDADQFLSMGFDEFFEAGGICCIEWSERIQPILPEDCFKVTMQHAGENIRHIEINPWKEP